jgi:cellulose synthase/poly-beta-1,6-N-acetylglucosamine synthase-like glycosyltransferase
VTQATVGPVRWAKRALALIRMRKFILKHEGGVLRLLELLPGFVSWNLILFPYWGIFVIPTVVAYFVLTFNIYWFYQSFSIAVAAFISHLRIQAASVYDWIKDLKGFPDWKKVHHVVIIPTYKEPLYILERTLDSLKKQTMPKEQMTIVLATEKKEAEEDRRKKVAVLKKKFAKTFANFFVTLHELVPGEVAGKSSNEKCAAIWAKKELVDKRGMDIKYLTVTSCDADTKFPPKYFACLAFKFLDDPERYKRFWQGPIMYYNNIWELPALTRVPNTFGSIWNMSQLPRKDRLINMSIYSLSFRLLDEVGYWDADKIPEDWGIFFKAYYKKRGRIEVEPIYLPVHVDAPKSTSFFKTLRGQYEQYKRWAWGASDDPWIIKNYFLVPGVPFWDKTMRLIFVMWAHFLWPVNWFIITLGLTLPTLINPRFARTALGYTVPKLSSFVLTIALVFLVIMIVLDNVYKPKRPRHFPLWRALIIPFEFILMPISGFFFNALPGIDAHTRLMLGKYIEYRVTEKV